MADKMTLTLNLDTIGKIDLDIETNLVDNLEKVPFIAYKLAEAMIQQLAEAIEDGETSVERTLTAAPEGD